MSSVIFGGGPPNILIPPYYLYIFDVTTHKRKNQAPGAFFVAKINFFRYLIRQITLIMGFIIN